MLNKTPIMTNKKYAINSVDLDFLLPITHEKFDNVEIIYNNVDIICDLRNNNCLNNTINTLNTNLDEITYGLGEEILNNTKNYSNHILNLNSNSDGKLDIVYNFDTDNTTLINLINITASHDLDINLIYKMDTDNVEKNSKIEGFLNSLLKINVMNNSNVNVNIMNLLNDRSNVLLTIDGNITQGSKALFNIIDLGGINSLQNVYLKTLDDNSSGYINSMYIGNNNEFKDLNYITHLFGKKSKINIDVIGSLNDTSKKNFKGTIDFKKGCKHSIGEEKEHCILLSKSSVSKALPILLCSEEDVQGAHSSSSGSVEADKIYYMMSRGLNKKEAVKLLVKSKFNCILEKIENEEYVELINREIDRRIK